MQANLSHIFPVESRLFYGTQLNDFIEQQINDGFIVLTRFVCKYGIDCLYEYQRIPMSYAKRLEIV